MTFITHGFRVSVVSDVRERVRDLASSLRFMLRRSSLVECVSVLHGTSKLLKFVGPRGQKIMRSANNVGPHVCQTFLNDVFTFLTEVGNAGCVVNTGTSSVNSEFVTALNT